MSDKMFAIHWSEYEKFGCPFCGCDYSHSNFRCGNEVPATCGECGKEFMLLPDSMMESTIGIGYEGNVNGECYHPKYKKHPRMGIEKHAYKAPDIRPEGGGEYFSPRGIGYDLAGFVKSKEAGERIVAMFHLALSRPPKTWLDYRPSEPKWIQVKVQKEDADLDVLYNLTKGNGGIITQEMINTAVKNKI